MWLKYCRVRLGQYSRGRRPGILDAVHVLRPARSKVVVKPGLPNFADATPMHCVRSMRCAVYAWQGPGSEHIGQGHNIQGTLCPRGATSKNFRSGTHRSRTHQPCIPGWWAGSGAGWQWWSGSPRRSSGSAAAQPAVAPSGPTPPLRHTHTLNRLSRIWKLPYRRQSNCRRVTMYILGLNTTEFIGVSVSPIFGNFTAKTV